MEMVPTTVDYWNMSLLGGSFLKEVARAMQWGWLRAPPPG